MTPEFLINVAYSTVKAVPYCVLVTTGESGQANARLMQPFEPAEDFTIYMGVSRASRKIRDIGRDNRATLVYYEPSETAYVTLLGSAQLEDDLALRRQYWRKDWLVFYPAGPEGDDYTLIKFVPARIELINFTHKIAPEPYGLKPAVLLRSGDTWQVTEEE
jgi:general stress protein 26